MTSGWTPVFVLPNIPLLAAIECDVAALVPEEDWSVRPAVPLDLPAALRGAPFRYAHGFPTSHIGLCYYVKVNKPLPRLEEKVCGERAHHG
jgi:hypothetical protein